MEYTFITKDDDLNKYLFNLKEECIIKHEDNWYKEKSHTKLYPNIDEAKAKVSKPYYWILNAIDKYEDNECEDKELALAELGILVFKTNYYSQKLTSDNENIEAKTDLATSLINFGLSPEFVAEQMLSMETPKYARLDMDLDQAIMLIKSWI